MFHLRELRVGKPPIFLANPLLEHPRLKKKMEEYVASEPDHGYLKYGETFFRGWEKLVVCNIRPLKKSETFEQKHEREMEEARERINANNTRSI